MGKRKKKNDAFRKKKKNTEEKQNSATTMISIDEKGKFISLKLKLQGESFEKTY